MNIFLATTVEDLQKISPVLLQLRPQYDQDGLIAQIRKQQAAGYQVAYVEQAGAVLCVAGFVVGEKLAWGKHIYIDDLVTDGEHRSRGAGRAMLDWLKAFAREQGCEQMHLDSGVQRFPAHKFYLREGFCIASHHFSIADFESLTGN